MSLSQAVPANGPAIIKVLRSEPLDLSGCDKLSDKLRKLLDFFYGPSETPRPSEVRQIVSLLKRAPTENSAAQGIVVAEYAPQSKESIEQLESLGVQAKVRAIQEISELARKAGVTGVLLSFNRKFFLIPPNSLVQEVERIVYPDEPAGSRMRHRGGVVSEVVHSSLRQKMPELFCSMLVEHLCFSHQAVKDIASEDNFWAVSLQPGVDIESALRRLQTIATKRGQKIIVCVDRDVPLIIAPNEEQSYVLETYRAAEVARDIQAERERQGLEQEFFDLDLAGEYAAALNFFSRVLAFTNQFGAPIAKEEVFGKFAHAGYQELSRDANDLLPQYDRFRREVLSGKRDDCAQWLLRLALTEYMVLAEDSINLGLFNEAINAWLNAGTGESP